MNREKISFLGPDFGDFEIMISGLTSLTDFCKRVHLFFKKRENIPLVNYGEQPTTRTNADVCSQEYTG